MSEKDKATTENKEQEGETSRVVFLMEQQEHLKSMIAATVAEALTAHSLKDQLSRMTLIRQVSKNVNGHKGFA